MGTLVQHNCRRTYQLHPFLDWKALLIVRHALITSILDCHNALYMHCLWRISRSFSWYKIQWCGQLCAVLEQCMSHIWSMSCIGCIRFQFKVLGLTFKGLHGMWSDNQRGQPLSVISVHQDQISKRRNSRDLSSIGVSQKICLLWCGIYHFIQKQIPLNIPCVCN